MLLAARALGLGATQYRNAAKVLFPERGDAARQDLLDRLIEQKPTRVFGVIPE